MRFANAYVPYGIYWSTPFCKWQGTFANQHSLKFAAEIGAKALADRKVPVNAFDSMVLGTTIPQLSCFYGTPWVAGMMGMTNITGPMIGQACATGAQCVSTAAAQVDNGTSAAVLVVTADRCSNGPYLIYPNQFGPGGKGDAEHWVFDNFGNDPFARNSMLQTAENVAKEAGIDRAVQEETVLIRHAQYQEALKNDAAFHRRYMVTPCEVKDPSGRKVIATVKDDEGIFPTTQEGLSKLKPVMPDGCVTFGCQTFPADGNCGIAVTSKAKAAELSREKNIEVQILSYGQTRTKKGFMAMAVVPAAKLALQRAEIAVKDLKAIKTHNPFAVNDVYMGREMGIDIKNMNNYGSSLIFGHPQGPTGARLIVELIEELATKGGGYGLFAGCAAGDTAAAIVLKVNVK
jgi:acetyl-CoA acetyltransferase family protein